MSILIFEPMCNIKLGALGENNSWDVPIKRYNMLKMKYDRYHNKYP